MKRYLRHPDAGGKFAPCLAAGDRRERVELKHDGYRLQIHVRDGRVRLYRMNGNDWTKRYPRIVEEAARLRAPLTPRLFTCLPRASQILMLCIVGRGRQSGG